MRLPLVIALLFGGLATTFLVFPFGRWPLHRWCIRVWSRWLLAACGVTFRAVPEDGGERLAALHGCMLVANHISWLDIFAIHSLAPSGFVAKAEIRRWPLVGLLVARTGNLFIERGRRRAVHEVIGRLKEAMADGRRVAVFPEGTTGDGTCLLPFHANLIEAAVEAGARVVPIGVRYVDHDGRRATGVDFVGDTTFVGSVWRIIGSPTTVAEVHVLPAIEPAADATRHTIAAQARSALSARLGLELADMASGTPHGRPA